MTIQTKVNPKANEPDPLFSETFCSRLQELREEVRSRRPLIHCITNPISINDCANAVLAVGGRPIMAEHPLETEEITGSSDALALNLGNITDARMESMKRSGIVARRQGIPFILDAVGTACSHLRLSYARELIRTCRPSIIKGNISELRALCGISSHAAGIDAGEKDRITEENQEETVSMLRSFSKDWNCTVFCTGPLDLILEKDRGAAVENGCPEMSRITGTGCMANVLAASFLSAGSPFEAALLAAGLLGICGERSAGAPGPGSFRMQLLDWLYALPETGFAESFRWKPLYGFPSLERKV